MSNVKEEVVPIRGAIRTNVSNSTDAFVAGKNFSVFLEIQNPFEVPIRIKQVSASVPTELVDVDLYTRNSQRLKIQRRIEREQNKDKGFFKNLRLSQVRLRILGLEFNLQEDTSAGTAVARDVSRKPQSLNLMTMPFGPDFPPRKVGGADDGAPETKKEVNKYLSQLDALFEPNEPTLMQSGNTTIKAFTLRSRRSLWFKPASFRLHIEVKYEIDKTAHIDTVEHRIQINASFFSIVLGALLGGMGGFIANSPGAINLNQELLAKMFVTLLMAVIAVVIFARKKDVQPIIAVEDFWGGVVIGIIVAYSGPTFVSGLLGL